jgi:hypothetical protein
MANLGFRDIQVDILTSDVMAGAGRAPARRDPHLTLLLLLLHVLQIINTDD